MLLVPRLAAGAVALSAVLALASPAAAQLKLGVAGPITGPQAAFGAQLQNGTQLAVDDINAKGGVLGQKIDVEFGDDSADPKQGVNVANKFVGDGVTFVVGHFNSGVTMPASQVYADNGILMISPSATNPKITERGMSNVFRTCGRDDQQGKLWADWAMQNYKGKKVAIVHDKTTYGQGLADAARASFHADGGQEVLYEGVNAGEKDYSALVSKIKESGADLLMWGGYHPEGGLIIRQMRDQGLTTVMLSGDGITTPEFAEIGGDGVIGTKMSFGSDPTHNPAAAPVLAELKTKNINPAGYVLYSYAAVQVIAEAIEATKSTDTTTVAAYIHSGKPFDTVLGSLSFDSKGDRTTADYVMYTWKKGDDGKVSFFQD